MIVCKISVGGYTEAGIKTHEVKHRNHNIAKHSLKGEIHHPTGYSAFLNTTKSDVTKKLSLTQDQFCEKFKIGNKRTRKSAKETRKCAKFRIDILSFLLYLFISFFLLYIF
jgi:hypothetical protein